ncbi:MAG: hypothetical protein A2Z38_02075 [Planctomycetes bacterium RBG_19FT_COMBO_48_8]|nr:MAG: hypothetical protein A2Z38_02075 [Planctomycetes bacterium RBG_19FT_COMBO_48_8]
MLITESRFFKKKLKFFTKSPLTAQFQRFFLAGRVEISLKKDKKQKKKEGKSGYQVIRQWQSDTQQTRNRRLCYLRFTTCDS